MIFVILFPVFMYFAMLVGLYLRMTDEQRQKVINSPDYAEKFIVVTAYTIHKLSQSGKKSHRR